MRFRYPKRWSRAKRKARRPVDLRAWYRAEFKRILSESLDKIWGDEFAASKISWGDCGFVVTESERFVDDAEFLP